MNILIINGANLNKVGERNLNLYGERHLLEIEELVKNEFPSVTVHFFQSNIEGEIVNRIQEAEDKYDGLIINPGGYAHTSVSIRDALELCKIPKIEVHLSNLAAREDFRQTLLTASNCNGYISGFKEKSYLSAVYILVKLVNENNS